MKIFSCIRASTLQGLQGREEGEMHIFCGLLLHKYCDRVVFFCLQESFSDLDKVFTFQLFPYWNIYSHKQDFGPNEKAYYLFDNFYVYQVFLFPTVWLCIFRKLLLRSLNYKKNAGFNKRVESERLFSIVVFWIFIFLKISLYILIQK